MARVMGLLEVCETVSALRTVTCKRVPSPAPPPYLPQLPLAETPTPILSSLHPPASTLLHRASSPPHNAIEGRCQVVCVSAKFAAKVDPDTHTTSVQVVSAKDSRLGNAAVSPTKNEGSTNVETPAFARNPWNSPHSVTVRARSEGKSIKATTEYDSADSAADDLVISFHRTTRDTAVGVCGDLIGTSNFPAKTPATCRVLDVTFTIFIAIQIARRCPWSGTHTPDAGQGGGQVAVAVHQGKECAAGRGGGVPGSMAESPTSAAMGRQMGSCASAPADATVPRGASVDENDETQEGRRRRPGACSACSRGVAPVGDVGRGVDSGLT